MHVLTIDTERHEQRLDDHVHEMAETGTVSPEIGESGSNE